MIVNGLKVMDALQELSYHYQADIELLQEVCSRLERQCSLIKDNIEGEDRRTLFEISKESEMKSREMSEQLREAKERTDTLITYYQRIFKMETK